MHQRASFLFVAPMALPLITAACAEGPCSPYGTPSVQVTVVDSLTDAPAAMGAWLIIRDGAYIDSAEGRYDGRRIWSLDDGRTGTYDVIVRKANYRDWIRMGVEAKYISKCEFQPAVMTARLQDNTRSR